MINNRIANRNQTFSAISRNIFLIFVSSLVITLSTNAFACPDINSLTDRNCDQRLVIVCFGDSITFGTLDQDKLGYPGRLKALHPQIQIVNLGVPGEKTSAGRIRAGKNLPYIPEADYLILLEGVNDYFITTKSYTSTRDNLLHITKIAKNIGMQPYLSNLTDLKRNTSQVNWVSGLNRTLAPYKSIDLYSLGKGIIGADQLHPNANGYQAIAQFISTKLIQLSQTNKPMDFDQDGIFDFAEVRYRTSTLNPDSDGDGIKDGEEVFQYKSNPTVLDSDGDGYSDNFEITVMHSDPANPRPGAPAIKNFRILLE